PAKRPGRRGARDRTAVRQPGRPVAADQRAEAAGAQPADPDAPADPEGAGPGHHGVRRGCGPCGSGRGPAEQAHPRTVARGGGTAGLQLCRIPPATGDQITVQRLHQGVIQNSVSVTDSEIDNLLNSPNYKAGEVHLAHIQISIPGGADAAAIQASQAKAEQALAAIKGGMDFNAAAIRYSDAPDALDGGDLGW